MSSQTAQRLSWWAVLGFAAILVLVLTASYLLALRTDNALLVAQSRVQGRILTLFRQTSTEGDTVAPLMLDDVASMMALRVAPPGLVAQSLYVPPTNVSQLREALGRSTIAPPIQARIAQYTTRPEPGGLVMYFGQVYQRYTTNAAEADLAGKAYRTGAQVQRRIGPYTYTAEPLRFDGEVVGVTSAVTVPCRPRGGGGTRCAGFLAFSSHALAIELIITLLMTALFWLALHFLVLTPLQYNATHDLLCGMLNQQTFWKALDLVVRRCSTDGRDLCLVTVDLDGFKAVNDQYGHDKGDAVLHDVGTLVRSVRQIDLVGRTGGEEFCVAAEGGTETAKALAERLRRTIEESDLAGLRLTCSAGVATTCQTGYDAPALVAAADKALYASKEAGRNRVTVCETASEPGALGTGAFA